MGELRVNMQISHKALAYLNVIGIYHLPSSGLGRDCL